MGRKKLPAVAQVAKPSAAPSMHGLVRGFASATPRAGDGERFRDRDRKDRAGDVRVRPSDGKSTVRINPWISVENSEKLTRYRQRERHEGRCSTRPTGLG
jgi:hypothetical protein